MPKQSFSTILTDTNNELLAARIADDGQWRFPAVSSVPCNFEKALLCFEDSYFYHHRGVNPVSISRAFVQNIKAGKIVSGGSTITMQLVRINSKHKYRGYVVKLIEIFKALKIELHYTKSEILNMYVSLAPYGGNVVGAEAAAWRYFSRPLHQLSWAEYATLAVLPNAPALIYPGKNRHLLLNKRNRLLHKLYINKQIDKLTYSLALMEKIPEKPSPLPDYATHLLDYAIKNGKKGTLVKTSINKQIQLSVYTKLNNYIDIVSQNQINNACAVVVSLNNPSVKAYIGNTTNTGSDALFVDIAQAPRSSGSILKPFLYGAAIDAGLIHTSTLLHDIPVSIDNFAPSNFDKTYSGIVPAHKALSLSLNIPATLLLRDYGVLPFYNNLNKLGFTTINRNADNYGLSLILGGAEVTLWDLVKVYTAQAVYLNNFTGKVTYNKLTMFNNDSICFKPQIISEGAWWLVSNALTNSQRPGLEQNWQLFSSANKIAWKTGTSHGFRDAWAIGYNAGYLVAVWVGNAGGDGRPGLTGTTVAAPLMFQIFQSLPKSHWFNKPEMALKTVNLCAQSGFTPSINCPVTSAEMPINSKMPQQCNMHKKILLNNHGQQITMNCITGKYTDTVWFVLSPVAGYYYKQVNHLYKPAPGFASYCNNLSGKVVDIIYPVNGTNILIPVDFDQKHKDIVFEVAHVNDSSKLFWHIDNTFIGQTVAVHKLTVAPTAGKHKLLVVDQNGNSASAVFTVTK